MANLNLTINFLLLLIGISSARISNHKWYELKHITETPNFPSLWYDQTVDHSNPSDLRTFKQRYMVNEEYFNKSSGGPAFLFIGGKLLITSDWMTTQQPILYAKKYNGLFFQLEHRYYGKSEPGGSGDKKLEAFRYLTAEQALADIAQFIIAMNEKYNLNPSKWVMIGGSYSANLATWMRYKYPHLVAGSVAASAPVLARVDFSEYYEVVEKSIRTHSEACGDHITTAFQEIETKMNTSDGREQLEQMFNVGVTLNASGPQDIFFYDSIASVLAGAVQYNVDLTTLDSSQVGIDYCCSFMNNPDKDPLDNLADLYNNQTQDDISAPELFYFSWEFQTCDEFGYFQCTSNKTLMFGDNIPLQYFTKQCLHFGDEYNETFIYKSVERTNANFGGLNTEDLTNVISVHGSIDPWHVLGFAKDLNELSPVVIVEGASHCQVLLDTVPGEIVLPQLLDAQQQIIDIIGTWIN